MSHERVIHPTKLIERAAARGYWPTAMRVRRDGDQLVAVVEAWGPKHTKAEPAEQPTSRRGAFAQASLDL